MQRSQLCRAKKASSGASQVLIAMTTFVNCLKYGEKVRRLFGMRVVRTTCSQPPQERERRLGTVTKSVVKESRQKDGPVGEEARGGL